MVSLAREIRALRPFPANDLVFIIDGIFHLFQEIHAEKTAVINRGPFMGYDENTCVCHFMRPHFYEADFTQLGADAYAC